MTPDEVGAIRAAIDNLSSLIKGEGTSARPGVMGVVDLHSARIEKHDDRITRLERTLDRFKWTVIGWATAGATAGGGIAAIVLDVWRTNGGAGG